MFKAIRPKPKSFTGFVFCLASSLSVEVFLTHEVRKIKKGNIKLKQQKRSRSNQINFRVNEEEYKELSEKVDLSGRSQTDVILNGIRNSKIVIKKNRSLFDQKAIEELRHIGANFNQMVRSINYIKKRQTALNQEKFLVSFEKFIALMEDINEKI